MSDFVDFWHVHVMVPGPQCWVFWVLWVNTGSDASWQAERWRLTQGLSAVQHGQRAQIMAVLIPSVPPQKAVTSSALWTLDILAIS